MQMYESIEKDPDTLKTEIKGIEDLVKNLETQLQTMIHSTTNQV